LIRVEVVISYSTVVLYIILFVTWFLSTIKFHHLWTRKCL